MSKDNAGVLDLKDRKILYQLDLNSRQSNSEIAKKVGLSKDVVNYRIKKLEGDGFINGYYAVLDFSRLGYFSIRVYLNLMDASPKKEEEIIEWLVKSEKTFFVGKTDGPIDINVGFRIKDIYEFENEYSRFREKFKDFIANEQVAIFTKAFHFHRAYLLNKGEDEAKPELFGKEKPVSHDELDISILKLLAKNARIPTIEIARKLKKPAKTIAFRIKQMEKKRIIQGYRFIFDFNLFGYRYYKIDLTLRSLSRKNELTQYAHFHPNILYIDETIGGSDFEFDIEIKSESALYELIEELKANFPEIRYYKYFTLRKYYKLLYFPQN